jgi:glycosyltransferase involved in cell wall biosynthesis
VVHAAWGAPAVDQPTAWSKEDAPAAIVVVSTGRNPTALQAAMEGVAEATRSDETPALVFLDAAAVREHHGLWKRIEGLGLPERLSLIPDLESRRTLVLRADMLLAPEAYGDQRSITLDAMAAGMTVVALEDAYAEELVDDRTAVLVPAPSGSQWSQAVAGLLKDRGRARRIGREAHAFVRDRRRVSRYVGTALETYERLTRDEPIPFPGAAATGPG